jgi:hypothetical protein
MEASVCRVREWMEENHRGMIVCPYQPGQLVISKESCMKRYHAAQQETYEDLMQVDLFRYRVKKGLSVCLNCAIGMRLTAGGKAVRLELD